MGIFGNPTQQRGIFIDKGLSTAAGIEEVNDRPTGNRVFFLGGQG